MEGLLITILSLSVIPIMVYGQNLTAARAAVEQAKPNIDYDTFCIDKKTGSDKLACRIKSVPAVGFLVCKTPKIDDIPCKEIIDTEIENIVEIEKAGIKTVKVSAPSISGVKCGETTNTANCSGFLEGWVDNGQFQHIRDRIVSNEMDTLIAEVKDFTQKSGLNTTATDLTRIKNFMEVNSTKHQYQQICDLQGFFLKTGGFLVNDVPNIEKSLRINDSCPADEGEREPTTEEVLESLNKAIAAFEKEGNSSSDGSKLAVSFHKVVLIGIITLWTLCLNEF